MASRVVCVAWSVTNANVLGAPFSGDQSTDLLVTEGDGLGVHPVRAADHDRVLVLQGAALEYLGPATGPGLGWTIARVPFHVRTNVDCAPSPAVKVSMRSTFFTGAKLIAGVTA